jgi:hypothetical protein
MAPSRVDRNKVQTDTSQEGIGKGSNFQAPIAQVDNGNHFDVDKSNVSDKVDEYNTYKDCVDEEIDQADTSHEGICKRRNFQASPAQVDNINHFDIAELNVLDKVDKSNTSKDHVGEDTYYLDTMHRTVSTFLSQSAVDYEKNKPRALFL